MYIYKIIIKNYRNLQDFSWKPHKHINVLFGHNGCGKTNIAEALSLLFTPNRFKTFFDKSDYHFGNQDNKIIIQAWLADIESFDTETSLNIQHIDKDDNLINDDSEESVCQVIILQLESVEEYKMEWSFVLSTGRNPCRISNRSAIDYNYIDTERHPIKEVGFQTKSILYQLSKESIGDELDKISKEIVDVANEKIKYSQSINDYLSTLYSMGKLDIIEQYKLLLKSPCSTWNSSGYELGTGVGEAVLTFDKQSTGIQCLFLLLLMKKKLEGSGIIFIEELEQSLEPKNQRYIADEYRKLDAGQIFITTHSTDIISHFQYDNIFVCLPTGAKLLLSDQDLAFVKLVTKANKKEFIASLMSSKVLLVEGDSEYGSFPVYSYANGLSLSYLDAELVRIEGKGNFKTYAKAYQKLGKTVYILLDNDKDIGATTNEIKKLADKIILADKDYEDLIYPYIKNIANELTELLNFQVVKNKLMTIGEKEADKCKEKEITINQYIKSNSIKWSAITTYCELAEHETLFKYSLHDSFASIYFATAVANIIVEKMGTPLFFSNLIKQIEGKSDVLVKKDDEENVWILSR